LQRASLAIIPDDLEHEANKMARRVVVIENENACQRLENEIRKDKKQADALGPTATGGSSGAGGDDALAVYRARKSDKSDDRRGEVGGDDDEADDDVDVSDIMPSECVSIARRVFDVIGGRIPEVKREISLCIYYVFTMYLLCS